MSSTPSPDQPSIEPADTEDARNFALSEDWLATIAGLAIVILAAAGVITADWIPL